MNNSLLGWNAERKYALFIQDPYFIKGTFKCLWSSCYIHNVNRFIPGFGDQCNHDDVIKWKIFRVTGHLCGQLTGHRWIPRTKGQWRGALMFSLIFAWINGWVNNREAGDLRRFRAHYDVTVMLPYDVDRVTFMNKNSNKLPIYVESRNSTLQYITLVYTAQRWRT